MKIISWNVNSVRARINNILNYINQAKPGILLLQEIKTQDEYFPYEDFKKIGYESYVFGQKSYNGVAIVSKEKVNKINKNLIEDDLKQSRIISGEIQLKKKKIELINIYVPNGN
ncbi:exodeoxyribonuclease III, partial [Candidatus Pelagibacter bacterium]|nr:exodeoxyribonuclease III [Candidatus Pelagibacter bacterium]